jgi:chitinase
MPPVGTRPENDDSPVTIKSTGIYNWPSDKKLILYFTNWGVYGRNYQVKDLPIDNVTGINYGFYDLRKNTSGNYVPTSGDKWADSDQRYTTAEKGLPPLDTWNDDSGFYGNFGQFKKLKDQGKKFNLGLSVGGWSWSGNFSPSVSNENSRKAFVDEVIAIFKEYPVFNRLDLDWEYISPGSESYGLEANISTPADAGNFAKFMKLMKESLVQNGMGHYEMTACTTADPKKMDALPIKEMVQYLDTINIMTYDFANF